MECVATVSYNILINGFPLVPFQAKKGLRQEDPMSTYMFALCMEYLSRCLNTLSDSFNFSHHPKCKRTNTTCLLFANDLLIFCKGNIESVTLVKQKLEKFSKVLDLCVNLDKSAVYTAGVDEVLQQRLVQALGM